MIAPLAPVSFPRGVADPGTSRAYVCNRSGTVMMLDLATGQVLWREGAGLRPLALVGDMLVTARIVPSGIEIVVLDTADGHVRRVSKPLPLPDWTRPSLDDSPEFTVRAEAEGQSVVIRWSAQTRYQGGAPPAAQVRANYERDAHGGARVDLETGAIELLHEDVETTAGLAAPPAIAASEDDVLEQQDIGDKRFQLIAQSGTGGTVKVLLRAIEGKNGKTLWQSLLEEAPLRRPKALRP